MIGSAAGNLFEVGHCRKSVVISYFFYHPAPANSKPYKSPVIPNPPTGHSR